jgi:hypothetical protein
MPLYQAKPDWSKHAPTTPNDLICTPPLKII